MRKLKLPVLLLLTGILNAYGQNDLLEPFYKYLIGEAQPDTGWYLPVYNDSSWLTGNGTIGYGDIVFNPYFTDLATGSAPDLNTVGDTLIQTIIPDASSIYIRYLFTLNAGDTAGMSGLSLDVYFDDGFIAYLNGAEFARINMGRKGDPVDHTTLADRSHESQIAAGDPFPVPGYFINKTFLKNHLLNDTNVIAIELHNDSLAGSDLFLKSELFTCYADTNYDPILDFWSGPVGGVTASVRAKACIEIDSSHLPLILIETDEFGIPFSHEEVIAHMKVIDQGPLIVNHPADTNYAYDGRIRIEVRGGSSSYFPKQSFNIETQHEDGTNYNTSLLGMPEENDWKLIGPISDRSLIRHTLTYELGRQQGRWEPRSKFCELILNGEYLGLYVLIEKIKPDANRLDISRLSETDIYGDELSGGYIFWKMRNFPPIIYYPSENKIQDEQGDYITQFTERYFQLLFSNDWLDPQKGYRNYINTSSFIDYLIINELAFDHDKYSQSTYMYKDRNDKDSMIFFGPLWDYNYAYGNTNETMATDKWRFDLYSYPQLRRYFQDTLLVHEFAEEWHNQRMDFLQTDSIYNLIDSLTLHIHEARMRDSMVWQAYSTVNVYFANDTTNEYSQIIHNLKDWIERRVTWMDTHIDSIYYPLHIYPEDLAEPPALSSFSAYPNPFRSELFLMMNDPINGKIRLELRDPSGRLMQLLETSGAEDNSNCGIHWELMETIPPGSYFLSVWNEHEYIGTIPVFREIQ